MISLEADMLCLRMMLSYTLDGDDAINPARYWTSYNQLEDGGKTMLIQ